MIDGVSKDDTADFTDYFFIILFLNIDTLKWLMSVWYKSLCTQELWIYGTHYFRLC